MPVIKISKKRLHELVGEELSSKDINDVLFNLKSESEPIDEDKLEVEINSDRPDLFITEGLARAVKGLLEIEIGLFQPKTYLSNYQLKVVEKTSRPYIGLAIIKNYPLTEEVLEELIQFQEKLHITIGRKRRKMAIGIHDLDKIGCKNIEYRMVELSEKMIPLDRETPMTIKEVLKETPQGREYGKISVIGNKHPAILVDDEIISLPPVINSNITRLEPGTKNLLIDVTGTDQFTVLKTLDILTSILNERDNSEIGLVKIDSFYHKGTLPILERDKVALDKNEVSRILGFNLTIQDIRRLLNKMRMEIEKTDENTLYVTIPEYRIDIIHPVDIIEDIAMAYGYNSLPLTKPTTLLAPSKTRIELIENIVRNLSVGLGFQEVNTHILVGEEALLFDEKDKGLITVKNPVTETMKYVRRSILPSLMIVLKESQGEVLPIKIFETGEIAFKYKSRYKIEYSLGLAIMKDEVGYEEIQASTYSLLRSLGLKPSAMKTSVPYMIDGRTAFILANDIRVGIAGEIHPSVLNKLNIKYPVIAAEINISRILSLFKKSVED